MLTYLKNKGNIVISPLGIISALVVIKRLALGKTLDKITNFKLGINDFNIYSPYEDLKSSARVANSLWTEKNHYIDRRIIHGMYVPELSYRPFPAFNKNVINAWASRRTEGKISDICSGINKNDKIFFLNVAYFFEKWKLPFEKIEKGWFYQECGSCKEIDLMKRRGNYRYGYFKEESPLPFYGIKIPYEKDFSMYIFMPDIDKIDEFVEGFSFEQIHSSIAKIDSLREEETEVGLPQFKIETNLNVKEFLKDIGLSIFDSSDTYLNDFKMSSALQKSLIETDEEGATAAAATSVRFEVKRVSDDFNINRAFLFVLKEDKKNIPLFVGVLRDVN